MVSSKKVLGIAVVLMALCVCFQATTSYAWERREGQDHGRNRIYGHERPYYHAQPYFGLHVSFLPKEAFSVTIGGSRYYYHQGYYYFRDRDDYVIATGETHSVKEFISLAFDHVGLRWKDYVTIDKNLYRPAEVQLLKGDCSKARKVLGWKQKVSFEQLVKIMIEADLEYVKKNGR